ncbi:NAD(P)-binding protein [Auricularia subglabra TFB-10046 SS5]|nr:NAD(P)-binding protein [Auricularia subglabra TFB-10046 SS5]
MSRTFNAHTTGDEVVSAFADWVKGRIFLLTGPNPSGLGSYTLYSLARAQPRALVLVGRNPTKIAPVVEKICSIDPNILTIVVSVDFASLASVRAGAEALLADDRVPHIDVFINNAVVVGLKALTVDGVETHFQVNHLAPFLFTNLLLPKVLKAPAPRVVTLSARVHAAVPRLEKQWAYWDKVPREDFDPWMEGYAPTKLANMYFAAGLVKRFGPQGLKAFSLHPGSILTGLAESQSPEKVAALLESSRQRGWDTFLKSFQQGVSTTLVAALDPALDAHNGAYLLDCQISEPGELVKDEAKAEELWVLSERIVGQSFP